MHPTASSSARRPSPPSRAPRTWRAALAITAMLATSTAAFSCGSAAKPAAAPAAAPSTSWSSPLPTVSYAAAPKGACAPLDPARDYEGDAYAFAKHEVAVADAVQKAYFDAGGGARGAAAANHAFAARRDELARDYRALCAALPARISESMMRTLQLKTGFAIYEVCTHVPNGVSEPSIRATLGHLCDEFRGAVGQR